MAVWLRGFGPRQWCGRVWSDSKTLTRVSAPTLTHPTHATGAFKAPDARQYRAHHLRGPGPEFERIRSRWKFVAAGALRGSRSETKVLFNFSTSVRAETRPVASMWLLKHVASAGGRLSRVLAVGWPRCSGFGVGGAPSNSNGDGPTPNFVSGIACASGVHCTLFQLQRVRGLGVAACRKSSIGFARPGWGRSPGRSRSTRR